MKNISKTRPARKVPPSRGEPTGNGHAVLGGESSDRGVWNLRLYVAGQTPKSLTAYSNLKQLCERYLPGRHRIEVVDLCKDPHMARTDQIVAVPTLVRKLPPPLKRIIGDLSNHERALISLDLKAFDSPDGT